MRAQFKTQNKFNEMKNKNNKINCVQQTDKVESPIANFDMKNSKDLRMIITSKKITY